MNFVEGFTDGDVLFTMKKSLGKPLKIKKLQVTYHIYFECRYFSETFPRDLTVCDSIRAKFNGVLCGCATWAGAVPVYIKEGADAYREWLCTEGFKNIDDLNKVLADTASSWEEKVNNLSNLIRKQKNSHCPSGC